MWKVREQEMHRGERHVCDVSLKRGGENKITNMAKRNKQAKRKWAFIIHFLLMHLFTFILAHSFFFLFISSLPHDKDPLFPFYTSSAPHTDIMFHLITQAWA